MVVEQEQLFAVFRVRKYFLRECELQILSLLDTPFIPITFSKPLLSSGSWLTLHNCEIYYVSAVIYDHQGQYLPGAMQGLTANFLTHSFYQRNYLARRLTPLYYQRSLFIQEGRGRWLPADFSTHLFIWVTAQPEALPLNISRGHYLPCEIYCLFLLV